MHQPAGKKTLDPGILFAAPTKIICKYFRAGWNKLSHLESNIAPGSCARKGGMKRRSQFEALALPHMDAAYNLSSWLLRDRGEAEDAVQDAYLRAWRAFDSWRGEDFKPWLFTIVRNVAYRRLRDRRRSAQVISIDDVFDGEIQAPHLHLALREQSPGALQQLIAQEDSALVNDSVAKLPAQLREVIILREMEDMSYKEIAEITGVPMGTVMSRLARARDILWRQLSVSLIRERPDAV